MKTFSIYRSSAGSGKTRTLAKEYLKMALRNRVQDFRHILAVTFTNKATQEMKDRILEYVDQFAKGEASDLASELCQELALDPFTFQQRAEALRSEILHHYAQFSISTIDAFFQKVIRSFTRESGIIGDYRLEVEHENVMEEVIDNLIDELGANNEITDWVVEFARENLENERAWDVRDALLNFSREIFREEFKAIEELVLRTTSDREFFRSFRKQLWQQRTDFFTQINGPAERALSILSKVSWDANDIYYGRNSGLFSFFEAFAGERDLTKLKVSDRVRNDFVIPEKWPGKKTIHAKDIVTVAREQLVPIVEELIQVFDTQYEAAVSADAVLKNMYVFGLITDISRKLKEYKDDNNLMLLADAPKFLNGVIQDSDTPFIYEKVGSFYRNFLIDEFQDTSGLQWKNFLPLLTNSLDQGYQSLVVGDVKQAIYRWRGGDLSLLQQDVEQHIGPSRVDVKELNSNYRSSKHIVEFNNKVFESAALKVAADTGVAMPQQAYGDVAQHVSKADDGFVEVSFIEEEIVDGTPVIPWKEESLDRLAMYVDKLQLAGVPLKDIAILVRKNEDGQQIVNYLLAHKNSAKANPQCRYDVVSNESLRLDGAASVNLLLGALHYLHNPDDAIARAQLGYEFAKLHEPDRVLTEVFTVTEQTFFEHRLPAAFAKEKMSLKKLPLYELTETLIEIFRLGEQTGELSYLQAFQDVVLEFYSRERNDLGAFLEWWQLNKRKKSIQVSGEVDAIQILTIHKSKGLQFRYVIVPFCSWSMDHEAWQAPNLWVASEAPPFNDAGFVPVKYGGVLEKSVFRQYYEEERTRTFLDNLNLLYVAFTRAEKGLMVMAPHPKVKNARNSAGGLLHDAIKSSIQLQQHFNETLQQWINGTWPVNYTTERPASATLSLRQYTATRWRDKLVIRRSAPGFFNDTPDDKRTRISYGIHLHTILARITYRDDVAASLEKMVFEGLITEQEKGEVFGQLQQLLEHPIVGPWFEPGWEVRTEVPILLPGGEENRIDRLLLKGRQAVVIDFKTGSPAKADQRQVVAYMDVLRQMNFSEVKGYLLYIGTGEVVPVPPGRPKVSRQRDASQLGLDF